LNVCGVAGFLQLFRQGSGEMTAGLSRMTDRLVHRGPDDEGIWVDANEGIALGHRRLSVLDLSPQGHQPMLSASGRYVVAFNGEIYNHRALRSELESGLAFTTGNPQGERAKSGALAGRKEAVEWRGRSDTEVMLAAFEHWGVPESLERFNGMFAFALWDRRERVLHLARDRFGEKPLYYGWMGNAFLFGSELKALKAHPAWRGEIDRGALALYMRHNCIPAPYSIYHQVRKLLPAHILSLPARGGRQENPKVRPYWSAREVAEAGMRQPYPGSDSDAVAALDRLLRDAVAMRMEADVSLGALLSGGIDSSTVVALMQAQSSRPVKTFSIGFHEHGYNEADKAKSVARHLGTEHTELYVSPDEAMAVIPRLPEIYDEPFADSSQIPTFLVSQMTRQHVTVALSGDAGDELFGGYNRHFWGPGIWRMFGWMPRPVRTALSRGLTGLAPQSWDKIQAMLGPALPGRLHVKMPGDKLHKLAGILTCASPEEMYGGLVTHWDPGSVVLGASELPTILTDRPQRAELPDFSLLMMFLDMVSYLPDDILTKVDRASMAVSLEARVPFLDHRVAEFAWQLPLDKKIRRGQGKWILRQVLGNYVPMALVDRPKMGFAVPIDAWLRGPLREWAEGLLDESRLRQEGYFDATPIRRKWAEHLSGHRNWQYHLWDALMFQAWLARQ
jgi:asparagine synthase (glutamine-hydrolysing)